MINFRLQMGNLKFKFLLILLIPCFCFSKQEISYDTISPQLIDRAYVDRKIDSIMMLGIEEQAFPGAQLLVALENQIIFHRAYGYHTYDSIQKVELNAIYDLASVTKITGPLPAIMKLYEEGKLDLDKPFSAYWKPWRNKKDKKDITLRELLAHQAGLTPYIVFLADVMKDGELKKRFIKAEQSKAYTKQAYKNLYVKNRFKNKMYRKINRSPVSNDKKYLYSGLASLIYPQIIEDLSGQSYEAYLDSHFYTPLGCQTLTYNPSQALQDLIVPTEIDTLFRHDLTRGFVHDENAALMGGVSGNAGLFGSAFDLAIYMQMLVQMGEYASHRYLKKETVEEFIRIQYPENDNRRGLGFDKPLIGNDTLSLKEAYPAPEVSSDSFGHSGFTGTFVWADPKKQLVFIFLSNRVFPYRSHRNLYNLNIRPALQQVFYQALNTSKN